MSDHSHEPSEGNSPAAWTAVVIMLVAFSVGTIAFFFDLPVVVWIAAVVAVLGVITGYVLKRLGYGVYGAKYTAKEH